MYRNFYDIIIKNLTNIYNNQHNMIQCCLPKLLWRHNTKVNKKITSVIGYSVVHWNLANFLHTNHVMIPFFPVVGIVNHIEYCCCIYVFEWHYCLQCIFIITYLKCLINLYLQMILLPAFNRKNYKKYCSKYLDYLYLKKKLLSILNFCKTI